MASSLGGCGSSGADERARRVDDGCMHSMARLHERAAGDDDVE
jgi:hypothetical protein